MRKIKLLIVLVFLNILFIYSYKIYAHAPIFEIKWSTTSVKVPIHADLSYYVDKPKPKLYIDGIEKSDAVFTISKDGSDELYGLEDIDVSKPGRYIIYYKAIESRYRPGHCTGYKTAINFIITDEEAPTVRKRLKGDIKIYFSDIDKNTLDTKIKAYLEDDRFYQSYFIYQDNYTETKDIKIIKLAQLIEKGSVLGEDYHIYKLTASFADEFGNKTSVDEKVTVMIGEKYSYILKSESINITKEELDEIKDQKEIPFRKYVDIIKPNTEITEQQKKDIYNSIEIKNLENRPIDLLSVKNDIQQLNKEINVVLKFPLASNLEFRTTIKIISDYTPILKLKKIDKEIKISTGAVISDATFRSYIERAEFIDGSNAIDNVIIDSSLIDNKKVGTYPIYLSLTEVFKTENNREVKKTKQETIIVKIVSNTPPMFETDIINIKVGDMTDLKKLIKVYDKTDDKVQIEIDDSNININEEGTYFITAVATNSSDLKATTIIQLNVKHSLEEKEELINQPTLWTIILLSLGSLSGAGYLTYYLIKKYKRKNENQEM